MHPRYMTERITFLKRRIGENQFGERIEEYMEVGKGWAAIKFKSVDFGAGESEKSIVYQATMQRSIPKFHRFIWRQQHYALKSAVIVESNRNTVTMFVQAV
ncbi:phage head completion protein [Candidatus Paracaedibacter symbiosus]|uniref:phage head completion protein n=1 Tax=Candidatus Paracaedibacter symbiosus TaxID=244582 RepID=UPI00050939BD|nr:hypothetical protein [Candidatus Paracaedibacter symbiosus]